MAVAPLENLGQRIAQQQSELATLRREYRRVRTNLPIWNAARKSYSPSCNTWKQTSTLSSREARSRRLLRRPGKHLQARNHPCRRRCLTPSWTSCRQANGPMRVKQIAEEVVRGKFPTTSSDILNMVATRVRELIHKGRLRRAGGEFGVVPGKPPNGQSAATGAGKHAAKDSAGKGFSSTKNLNDPGRLIGKVSLPFDQSWPICSGRANSRCRRRTGPAGAGGRLPHDEQELCLTSSGTPLAPWTTSKTCMARVTG